MCIDNDAYNPHNPKGMKIVEDQIRDNKGEKQHEDHDPEDEDWKQYWVYIGEEKYTGSRDSDGVTTTVSGNVECSETATRMLAELKAPPAASSSSAMVPSVITADAKAAAKAAANAAAAKERQAKAKAKAEALKAVPGPLGRPPPGATKKRKTIQKEHTAFAELLAGVKRRNNEIRAIASPTSHDATSVIDMDKHIVSLTSMKDKLEAMATAPVPATPEAIEVVLEERDALLNAITSEEQYQKDRMKRMQPPKAPVAKASPAAPPSSLASASEARVQ